MTIRFAHISDSHLGYSALNRINRATGVNQRTLDVQQAFERALDDIVERKVDFVIHSGDLFDHPRPPFSHLRAGIRALRKLERANIPTVIIGGNHDTPRMRNTTSALDLVAAGVEGLTFRAGFEEDEVTIPGIDGVLIHAAPHGRLAMRGDPLSIHPDPRRINIVTSHGFVHGMQVRGLDTEHGQVDINESIMDGGVEYIALGHYHVYSHPRRNAWYAGSTERFGWGDLDVTPGYALVEIDGPGAAPRVEHIPVATRPMVRLDPIDAEGMEARAIADRVLRGLTKVRDPEAMVRVAVDRTTAPIRRDLKRIIEEEAGDLAWHVDVGGQNVTRDSMRIEGSDVTTAQVLPLFEQYIREGIERGNLDAQFAQKLREIGEPALAQAIADEAAASVVEEGAGE